MTNGLTQIITILFQNSIQRQPLLSNDKVFDELAEAQSLGIPTCADRTDHIFIFRKSSGL